MPVQFTKPQTNPATAERVAEVGAAINDFLRALAPAVEKVCEEMGRSVAQMRDQPRA